MSFLEGRNTIPIALRRLRREWEGASPPVAILAAILSFALLLRLLEWNYCMSPDEAYCHDEVMRSGWRGILLLPYGSGNHPFASLAGWLCGTLFGDHDWAYQLYPFITGMLSLPLIYLVAARAFRDRRTGWLAAFVLALSPYHAAYSANMRGYVPAMFFALLYVYFLLSCFERPQWTHLPFLALALFAMAMNHLASLMMLGAWGPVLAAFAAISLARRPRRWKSVAVACGGMGLGLLLVEIGYAPVFSLFHSAYTRLLHGHWPEAMNLFLSGAEQTAWHPFFRYSETLTGARGLAFLFPAALALLGLIPALGKRTWGTALIVASAAIPPAALLAVPLKLEPRYLLTLLPFIALLIAAGIAALTFAVARKSSRFSLATALLCLAALTAGTSSFYLRDFPHGTAYCSCVISDFKSATIYTAEHARENDLTLYDPVNRYPLDFYFRRYLYSRFPAAQIASSRRIWYVTDSFDQDALNTLSPYIPLTPCAYFRECAVWSAEIPPDRFLETALPPIFDTGANPWPARFAPWIAYAYNVDHSDGIVGTSVDDGASVLLIAEREGNATFFLESPKIPCAPGRVSVYQAQLLGDFSTRSIGIGVRYYAEATASTPLLEETTWEPQQAAFTQWRSFQLNTFAPPEIKYISIFWQIRETYGKQPAAGFKTPRFWMDTP